MAISAQLVKRLREETDAPMMECKRALEQAETEGASGDDALVARGKEILREGGKMAAGKRQDRTTAFGTIAVSKSGNSVAAVSLLCETDFVARNEDFIALAQTLANHFADNEPSSDPLQDMVAGKSVKEYLEEAVGKIRENIQLGGAKRITSSDVIGFYLHHDKAKAALVAISGANGNGEELANKIGTQVVALRPEYISKEQVDQVRLSKEIEIEKQKAIDDGKPVEMAEKIAQGKVNKEFLQAVVLLEQPWYAELSKKVGDVVGSAKVTKFIRLEAGKPVVESAV